MGAQSSWLEGSAFNNGRALQLLSALLYGALATGMGLVNRFALLVFALPSLILLLQMVATLAILYPLLRAGVLTFPMFETTRFRQLLGLGSLYTANVAFGLFALRTLHLPMFTALKLLTPAVTLLIKGVWKGYWPKRSIIASIMLVVAGCAIAGVGDRAFDTRAYAYCMCSVGMQATYLLLVEFQGDAGCTSTSELLWYNAIIALPMLTVLTAANGDFHKVGAAAAKGLSAHSPLYLVSILFAVASMGTALNFATFLCTLHNSALTTCVIGCLRSVATVLLGFALDSVPQGFSPANAAGIAINTGAGVCYTYLKYKEREASTHKHGKKA